MLHFPPEDRDLMVNLDACEDQNQKIVILEFPTYCLNKLGRDVKVLNTMTFSGSGSELVDENETLIPGREHRL